MSDQQHDTSERQRQELHAVNQERLRLRRELAAIHASRAWRLSLPLRALGAAMGRAAWPLRRRLRGLVPRAPGRRPPPGELGAREWLWRRRAWGRRATVLPPPGRDGTDAWLTPLLVDYSTRDGSTLMMRLLATSPQVAVELSYPFERKYFAYLWRWSRLVDRTDWPAYLWGKGDLSSLDQEPIGALLGPPPWLPRTLIDGAADEPSLSAALFEHAWCEFSGRCARRMRAQAGDPGLEVRYYAEKHLNTWRLDLSKLPPLRVVALLRDPRDTYASEHAAGMRGGSFAAAVSNDYFEAFVRRQRDRLRWIAGLLESGEHPVVRYEDLVHDLAGVAARLGALLGVELDAAEVEADRRLRRRHATASSPESSIGRWRQDLDPRVAARLGDDLGAELEAVGIPA